MHKTVSTVSKFAFPAFAAMAIVAGSFYALAEDRQAAPSAERLLEAEHLAAAILALSGDAAYGAYLGGECVTCHQQSGGSDGIPPIVGLPVDYTVQALVEYKLGIRTSDVMQLMTKRLANDEIAALAAYFAERTTD